MAMFFSGHFTQAGFKIVCEAIKLFIDEPIPDSFDKCAKIVLQLFDDKLSYTKSLYCHQCSKKIMAKRAIKICPDCKMR